MKIRWLGVLVSLAVLVVAAAAPAAFKSAFGSLRSELTMREASLASATDKTGKKQHAAVVKALQKLDALEASPAPSLALDLKTTASMFGPLEKAFPLEFPKKLPPSGALAAAMIVTADALRSQVELGAVSLTNKLAVIPAGKLKTSAQKQSDIAGSALGKSDTATSPTAIVKLLKTAQTAVTKGLATAAKAPVKNVVTATIGSVAYVGARNYIDYFPGSGGFSLITNADTAGLGGFASFDFSPFAKPVTGPDDYPITGLIRVGTDPGNNTQYAISSGTMHLATFDPATQRAAGSFTFTVFGHPELGTLDGEFDFYELRIQ